MAFTIKDVWPFVYSSHTIFNFPNGHIFVDSPSIGRQNSTWEVLQDFMDFERWTHVQIITSIWLWSYNTKQEQQLIDLHWNIRTSARRWFCHKILLWNFKYYRVQIKKGFSLGSLANNWCPIMFHCAKICVSYWVSHNN